MQILAKIKSRLNKREIKQDLPPWQQQHQNLPPLVPILIPQILPEHHEFFSINGWATISYNSPEDTLQTSYQELLQASQQFFELPEFYKQEFKTKLGSEEGWSRVEGEKEFITIRTTDGTPDILKDAATKYWAAAAGLLDVQLGRIAESLGLRAEAFSVYSEPCSRLGTGKTASMLRLFRYEGHVNNESHIVAEEHKDLGLLSLVTGNEPGLEVWARQVNKWYLVEKAYEKPAPSVLVGRQLELLSNERYYAGKHRVRLYSNPVSSDHSASPGVSLKYRHSVVFVLRAHSPVAVDTDDLTTQITGQFQEPLRDMTAGQMFKKIYSTHFNINTHVKERREQERKLAERSNVMEKNA